MKKTLTSDECSNNTNKLSPQEQVSQAFQNPPRSNNTNKLSPQELLRLHLEASSGSNNTNKLSPQEHQPQRGTKARVQIIQINLALKNQ